MALGFLLGCHDQLGQFHQHQPNVCVSDTHLVDPNIDTTRDRIGNKTEAAFPNGWATSFNFEILRQTADWRAATPSTGAHTHTNYILAFDAIDAVDLVARPGHVPVL